MATTFQSTCSCFIPSLFVRVALVPKFVTEEVVVAKFPLVDETLPIVAATLCATTPALVNTFPAKAKDVKLISLSSTTLRFESCPVDVKQKQF